MRVLAGGIAWGLRASARVALAVACASAEAQQLILDRGPATVMVEPYAPNIVRITLSLDKAAALAAPGYGFIATAAAQGWTIGKDGAQDTLRSARMVVTVSPPPVLQRVDAVCGHLHQNAGGRDPAADERLADGDPQP